MEYALNFRGNWSLKLSIGSFHASLDKPIFGAIDDSSPDRWGRLLNC